MSDINIEFNLEPLSANLYIEGTSANDPVSQIVAGNNISLSPTNGKGVVTITSTGGSVPGGANTTLQYNNNGVLGGVSSVTTNGANVTFANIANLKINGGPEGSFPIVLNGTLDWYPMSELGNTSGGVLFRSGDYINGAQNIRLDIGTNRLILGAPGAAGALDFYSSRPQAVSPGTLGFSGSTLTFQGPTISSGNGIDLVLLPGGTNDLSAGTKGGSAYLFGASSGNTGGDVIITAGSGNIAGGVLRLEAGSNNNGTAFSDIQFLSGNYDIRIKGTGALTFEGIAGNAGQVLTSNGNNAPPTWTTISSNASGTVTSVGGIGTGLGFSLSGTVTNTGNLTLTTPTVTNLRSTLNIGNAANVNLSGDAGQFLTGTGAWTTAPVGSGTVTNVGGTGTGLGFSLSGTVTSSGNITLTTPAATDLRTSLTIGNVANLNLNGSTSQFLRGDGNWETVSTTGGGVSSVSGAGTGLGFSLTGTVTSSGSITLSTPTAAQLRTSLSVGNVANLNLNSSTTQFLRGDGNWANVSTNTGTVTSVGGTGSGLGFSLSGNITDSGNLTLATPTVANLRTSLGIGTVANLNLNNNAATFINGLGQFAEVATGTVTNVGGNGSGLGFSLSGTVTNTGNLTLATPTAAQLRTSLSVGNVANLNLNGNAATYLNGSGVFAPPVSVTTEISNVKVATEFVKLDWTGGNIVYPYNGSFIYDNNNNFVLANGLDIRPIAPATQIIEVGQSLNMTIVINSGTIPNFATMPFKIIGTSYDVTYAYYVPGSATNGIVVLSYVIIRLTSTTYKILGSVIGY